jgi:outer membrane lipoprotein SlyB
MQSFLFSATICCFHDRSYIVLHLTQDQAFYLVATQQYCINTKTVYELLEEAMEAQTKTNRIHPLVAAAAVGVLLFSLVGVAAMTGMLPNSSSTNNSKENVAELDAAAAAADKEAAEKKVAAQQAKERANNRVAETSPPPPAVCRSCGHVESVRAVQSAASPSGVGVVGGAVVGGLLGNQIGGGSGRTLATVAGAVGGGYAGNEIEKNTRKRTTYQVQVRMEDGKIRNFPYNNQPPWREGDRVRIVDGYLRAG